MSHGGRGKTLVADKILLNRIDAKQRGLRPREINREPRPVSPVRERNTPDSQYRTHRYSEIRLLNYANPRVAYLELLFRCNIVQRTSRAEKICRCLACTLSRTLMLRGYAAIYFQLIYLPLD